MEWYLVLAIIFGSLLFMLITGMPVALAFLTVSVILVIFMWGGGQGVKQLVLNIFSNVASFTMLPLILFILMGGVIFHSEIAPNMINALDKWLGSLPGRLGLLAVGAGTLLSTLTGASFASVAILGSTLTPEMEKRGYKKPMSLGPILGSGGLAMMIPPSDSAVLLAIIAQISIGKVLMGIIIPGLLMAILYSAYIIIRCILQPQLAPTYKVPHIPLSEKLAATVKYILPLSFIVFLVVGVIFLGIATPTEAGATGTLGAFILAAAYGRLNWKVFKICIRSSLEIIFMILMIIVATVVYGQILAFSGASRGLAAFVSGLPVAPIVIFIGMQAIAIILGMFTPAITVMMLTIPLYMPTVYTLGFNPVWFIIIMMLNMEMAVTSPPFGLSLFVMKGVAPPNTTMGDIYRAAIPFLICDLVAMALMVIFPALCLWLPSVMR